MVLNEDESCQAVHVYGEMEAADTFAGLYVTDSESSNWQIWVLFVDGLSGHAVRLAELGIPERHLRIRPATYTLAALNTLIAQISKDFDLICAHGVEIVGVGLDVERNLVSVEVARESEAAVSFLERRYDAAMFYVHFREPGVYAFLLGPASAGGPSSGNSR